MVARRWIWSGLLAGALGWMGGGWARAQRPVGGGVTGPAVSVGGELRAMAARAGVVFVGEVQRIVPKEGVVEITFLVQRPVLGVTGGRYVMREWAGRWTGGQQRYRVGQRAMFFLHAPSAAGLSSPVDGMAGVVPLIPMGANADAVLDARWLMARVVRRVGDSMGEADQGAVALTDAVMVVRHWRTETTMEPTRRSLPAGVGSAEGPKDVPGPAQVRGQADGQR